MISAREVQCISCLKFISECLEYFEDYNGGLLPEISADECVYIVNNGTKDVGIFTINILPDKSEIQPMFWMHPKSCKMGLLAIQKAAAVYCYTRAFKEGISLINIRCKDLLTCRAIKRICPGFVSHSLTHNIHQCVCTLDDIQDKYKVDSDYCFALEI